MTTNNQNKSIFESIAGETADAMQCVLNSLNLLGDEELSPGQSAHFGRCLTSVHRVIHILDDVLMLGKSPLKAELTRFSPVERIYTIAEVLAPLAKQRNLSVEVDSSPGIPFVDADAAAFEQIVTRTLEYAIRTVLVGPISISIQCFDRDGENGNTIQVGVRAPEWPILEDHVALCLARAFASRMGTTLQHTLAESRIELSIPVTIADPKLPGADKLGIRILVAEDCDDSYNLLSALLEDQPYSLNRATDGDQAVAMATSGRYDMAFMDINMPRLNGYAATQRIRDWETVTCRKRMPIIVLSSNALESQLRDGAIVGCSGYLEKPVPRAILVRTISRYLGASHSLTNFISAD